MTYVKIHKYIAFEVYNILHYYGNIHYILLWDMEVQLGTVEHCNIGCQCYMISTHQRREKIQWRLLFVASEGSFLEFVRMKLPMTSFGETLTAFLRYLDAIIVLQNLKEKA